MYAYALGLLLPLVFFFIKNALDTYVHTKNDILNAVNDIPVVGEIPTIQKGASMVIGKNDLSSFAESFRILVSNTKYFFNKKDQCPVILVSSSIKGEGKTTISVNTALTLAQTKNVLLIGADIRNPQLKRFMHLKGKGLSEFLSDYKAIAQDFIAESSLNPNLKVIILELLPQTQMNC
jgi:Mrp family chromosome partitioning ATPase